MNGRILKKLRKKFKTDTEEILMIIRNDCGKRTEKMGPRQIYQHTKRLYKVGKIKLWRKE